MAICLLTSAPPIFLSPPGLFLHRHLVGDGRRGSLRLHSPAMLPPLRISLTRGLGAAGCSQDAAGFLSGVNPSEIPSAVHNSTEGSAFVEGEVDSDHPRIWKQMKEIALFAGPATGLWICGPLMSLIDTMVVGQGNSLELAALGPGTVFCDYLSYIFMFLSIATSNMVATSLAKKFWLQIFLGICCELAMVMHKWIQLHVQAYRYGSKQFFHSFKWPVGILCF